MKNALLAFLLLPPIALAGNNIERSDKNNMDSSSVEERVIGGDIVTDTSIYQSYVSFRTKRNFGEDPNEEVNGCGGVLIADRWVATARHCQTMYDRDTNNPSYVPLYQVGVGINEKGEFEEKIDIEEGVFFIYPADQLSNGKSVDVALVKLKRAVSNAANKVVPIFRPHEKPFHSPVTLVGLGMTLGGSSEPEKKLRYMNTVVASDEFCHPTKPEYSDLYMKEYSLCTGIRGQINRSGSGDSGGPLYIRNAKTGKLEVIGTVQGGVPVDGCDKNCERPGATRYTMLSRVKHWIYDTIENN